jgi:hypothetical protein
MKTSKFYRPFSNKQRYENDQCCCDKVRVFTWGGGLENAIGLIYIPNIRTYAILNRVKYKAGFSAINYCPFCGAELPGGLEEELTKILQNEYGLESWKDYKKAPHEFHTDEWWKKRGL